MIDQYFETCIKFKYLVVLEYFISLKGISEYKVYLMYLILILRERGINRLKYQE